MCMGWTWALFFCNEGTQSCIDQSGMVVTIKDKTPVPVLARGKPLGASYVDNLTLIAASALVRMPKQGLRSFLKLQIPKVSLFTQ
eukprot:11302247-Karenia_brevis.AAC.1